MMRKTVAVRMMGLAVAALVGLAAHTARADGVGVCAVVESPFTLAEIVETAVGEVPGDPVKAGFTVQPTGGDGLETLFKVKIAKDAGGRALLFYDTETGERVEPVAPAISFLDANDLAIEAVEARADAPGAIVVQGKLRRRVFVASYDFAVVDPNAKIAIARVDALSGDVLLLRPRDVARAKRKLRLAREERIRRLVSGRTIRCDAIEEEEDPEDEALMGA